MDKLKQVLVYRFWILLALALILPVIGWARATGALKEDAENRKKTLDTTFDSLPKGAEFPNKTWVEGVNSGITKQEQQVKSTWRELWDRQLERMTWPDQITNPLAPSARDLEVFREVYPQEVDATWKITEPLFEDETDKSPRKVSFPATSMPYEEFGNLPPSPAQMRDAQEDIWLLTALFQAIAELNKSGTAQFDSPVRAIEVIQLLGGRAGATAAVAAVAAPTGPATGPQQTVAPAAPQQGPVAASAAGPMTKIGVSSVTFKPSDEFGSDAEVAAPAGAAGAPGAAGTAGPGGPAPGLGGLESGGGGSSSSAKKAAKRRYIDDNPKWKTRGFYMELVMDHQSLPDLLANLANSPWPIRIVRVHQVDRHMEDLADANGAGGGAPVAAAPVPTRPGLGFAGADALDGASPADAAFNPPSANKKPARGARKDAENPAMADPMLANVAISGFFTIFNPPPELQQPAAATPGVPGSAPAGAPASAGAIPPAATSAAPVASPAPGAALAPGAAPPPAGPATIVPGGAPPPAGPAGGPAPAPGGAPAPGAAPPPGGAPPPAAPAGAGPAPN